MSALETKLLPQEQVQQQESLFVVKRDGRRQPFDPEKVSFRIAPQYHSYTTHDIHA
jgi:transcriptional regulator NrdR family protein